LGLEKVIAGFNQVEALKTEEGDCGNLRLLQAGSYVESRCFLERRRTDGEDRHVQTAWEMRTRTEELFSKHAVSRKLDEATDEEWGKHNSIRFVRDCPQLNTNFEKEKIILRDVRQTGHGRSLERGQ
jgi:hypothetical protein